MHFLLCKHADIYNNASLFCPSMNGIFGAYFKKHYGLVLKSGYGLLRYYWQGAWIPYCALKMFLIKIFFIKYFPGANS